MEWINKWRIYTAQRERISVTKRLTFKWLEKLAYLDFVIFPCLFSLSLLPLPFAMTMSHSWNAFRPISLNTCRFVADGKPPHDAECLVTICTGSYITRLVTRCGILLRILRTDPRTPLKIPPGTKLRYDTLFHKTYTMLTIVLSIDIIECWILTVYKLTIEGIAAIKRYCYFPMILER